MPRVPPSSSGPRTPPPELAQVLRAVPLEQVLEWLHGELTGPLAGGEVTIELVYSAGSFRRCHLHVTAKGPTKLAELQQAARAARRLATPARR